MQLTVQQEQKITQINRSLSNVTPSQGSIDKIESLRAVAKRLATQIIVDSEPSREQGLALTALEESVMWAVKGLVLNDPELK